MDSAILLLRLRHRRTWGSVPACMLLFVVSNLNSPNNPNLMRWLALAMTYGLLHYPTVLSLILLYAFPGKLSREVLVDASVLALGYLPPALVIIGLARIMFPLPQRFRSPISPRSLISVAIWGQASK